MYVYSEGLSAINIKELEETNTYFVCYYQNGFSFKKALDNSLKGCIHNVTRQGLYVCCVDRKKRMDLSYTAEVLYIVDLVHCRLSLIRKIVMAFAWGVLGRLCQIHHGECLERTGWLTSIK